MRFLAKYTLLKPLFLIVLVGCGGEGEVGQPIPPETFQPMVSCSEQPALSWENTGRLFLTNWCTGCHSSQLSGKARFGAPGGVDFETEALFLPFKERIEARTGGERPSMPPAGGPSQEERELFLRWTACLGRAN